jgi:hypothetical protein
MNILIYILYVVSFLGIGSLIFLDLIAIIMLIIFIAMSGEI